MTQSVFKLGSFFSSYLPNTAGDLLLLGVGALSIRYRNPLVGVICAAAYVYKKSGPGTRPEQSKPHTPNIPHVSVVSTPSVSKEASSTSSITPEHHIDELAAAHSIKQTRPLTIRDQIKEIVHSDNEKNFGVGFSICCMSKRENRDQAFFYFVEELANTKTEQGLIDAERVCHFIKNLPLKKEAVFLILHRSAEIRNSKKLVDVAENLVFLMDDSDDKDKIISFLVKNLIKYPDQISTAIQKTRFIKNRETQDEIFLSLVKACAATKQMHRFKEAESSCRYFMSDGVYKDEAMACLARAYISTGDGDIIREEARRVLTAIRDLSIRDSVASEFVINLAVTKQFRLSRCFVSMVEDRKMRDQTLLNIIGAHVSAKQADLLKEACSLCSGISSAELREQALKATTHGFKTAS